MKPKKDFSTASLAVIGVDIGKEVFHIVGLAVDGKIASVKRSDDWVSETHSMPSPHLRRAAGLYIRGKIRSASDASGNGGFALEGGH